ncbi:P1 family peptidase [Primorskyibacter flagellatus]|uniref:P1 family peptidase n=1 Tax=Primorskyibacter flagellatus TaxID=1387277 RepID=UPI003A922997
MTPGPRNLITDVTGLRVGNAQDEGLKSGTTVLTADAPFVTSYAVMGGAPGSHETDLLEPDKTAPAADALVLSGGSAFGLAAATGVMEALRTEGRGFAVGPARVPLVPAAIIFDLVNGGRKDWTENPYPALGAQAYAARDEMFELGSFGAGTGALTAMHKGGLGSASLVLDSGVTVGALVAVNPMGSVTTDGEQHFWAAPFEIGTEFGGLGPDLRSGLGRKTDSRKMALIGGVQGANTTIAIVATDAALTKTQAKRMAVAAHDGIGRAIVPAHAPVDGDLVFAASTAARPLEDPVGGLAEIGHAAALCLSRAIARGVYEAEPKQGDALPCYRR